MSCCRPKVRLFEERDRETIRDICRRTGQRGNPTEVYFEDEELSPILYVDYYLDYEPDLCFVAEQDGRVVGYLLGCKDTRRYMRVLLTRILPRLFFRFFWKIATFQYRRRTTYQTLWWMFSRSWREAPRVPLDTYPAHGHINLSPEYQGPRIGHRFYRMLRQELLRRDVTAIHVIIAEEEGKEAHSNYFIRKLNFELVESKPFSLWEKLTGTKWFMKLLVYKVPSDSDDEPDRGATD